MKKIFKFFILLWIFAFGFMLGTLVILNIKANSDSDINYTFERDVLFNQDDTDYYKNFNTREYVVYNDTGEFNATFSFTNDADGSNPANFTTTESGSNTVQVIAESHNHKKVVELKDVDGNVRLKNDFLGTENTGTVEWWGKASQTNMRGFVLFYPEVGNYLFFVGFYSEGTIRYYDGAYVYCKNYEINTWYHFRVDFDSDAQLFSVWIDEVLITGGDEPYVNTDGTDKINRISWETMDGVGIIYIDAIGYYFRGYTGESFDVSTQDAFPYGITCNSTNFFISGSQNDKIYEYYLNWTYTNNWFDSPGGFPRGITYNGTYIYIVDSGTDTVYKYTSNGVYTDESFYIGTQGLAPGGITWDGNYFWTTEISHDRVHKYYLNGTYTNEYFYTSAQDGAPAGIVWVENHFWITGYAKNAVYKYTSNGTYTGIFFNITSQDTTPVGITWDGEYFWIVGDDTAKVYQYLFTESTYNIGDNLGRIMLSQESGTEVDRWEFSHEGLFDRLDDGDDNPNGWTDLEDGEDDVNCRLKDDFDGVVELYANSGDGIGLYKDNLGYSNDIVLNVSFGFEINYIYSVLNNQLYMKIYSSDNTEIVRIRIRDEGTLMYWTTGSTYVSLDTGFVIDTNYSINLSIDYETDKCILRYTTNEVYTDSFEFPLTTAGKTGLKKVSFDVVADTDYCQVYLDYIGIYVDYRSITTDFGSIGLHISDHSYWYFTEYNLLTVDIIGDSISIYLDLADYVYSSPDFVHEVLISAKDYTGLEIINMYDYLYDDYWGYNYMWGGVLWFHFYDTFEFNEVNLEGVKLIEGENEYPLEYESSGVEIVDNYFYVLDNKLYFTQTSNDTNLEYIQATFDIDNLASGNRSVSYDAELSGNSEGYFAIEYQDATLTPLPLRTYVAAPNVILPQDKEISAFIILITDNDKDSVQGITTGYITNIKLNYIKDISINIIISALFEIIVPLLILIIPTFLFYLRLGKAAIIPTFVLMAFICFITNIIPLWLFFIILISSGTFLVLDKTILKDVKE